MISSKPKLEAPDLPTANGELSTFISNWRTVRSILSTYGPPSLEALREESIRQFESVGFPTHKTEEYKYTSLRPVEETDFKPAYGATVSKAEMRATPLGKLDAIRIAFINGEYAPELSEIQALPEGVLLLPLQDALEQEQELVMRHLAQIATLEGKLGTSNDERFVWLNNAYISEGAFLYLPKGVVLETPIHIQFLSKADHGLFAAFPRVLIVTEENAQAKIVETYDSLSEVQNPKSKIQNSLSPLPAPRSPYLTCAVTELYLAKHANVEHTRVQNESSNAFHIATIQAYQEESSVWTSTNVQLGARIGREDLNAFVDGEHCETWLNGVYLGTGEQLLDNHTRIDHAKPNCNSFEVYKGILADTAHGVFNGKIFVYEDAQKTDAKQTNQALLLSKTASVDTKPQLEIFADDVKCTHGATVGQISKEMLFYLRSRGIPESQARALLVYAFAAAGLEKISIEQVKESLEKQLTAKLHQETPRE